MKSLRLKTKSFWQPVSALPAVFISAAGRVEGSEGVEGDKKVEMRKEARRDPGAVPPQPLLVYLWIGTHCLRDLSGVRAGLLWMQIVIMLLSGWEEKKKKKLYQPSRLPTAADRRSRRPRDRLPPCSIFFKCHCSLSLKVFFFL